MIDSADRMPSGTRRGSNVDREVAILLFLVTKCCAILFIAMFSKIIQKIGWQLHKFIQP
jgi:hypothetical protein